MKAQGITTGWSDGTFRPDSSVNRDSMAAFFYRYADSPAYEAPAQARFTDVSTDNMFYREISWLASQGVTTGWPDRAERARGRDHRRSAFRCAGDCPFCWSRRHSGHITPTAAGVWHSGQMVRRHRWQSTKLCRSGCR